MKLLGQGSIRTLSWATMALCGACAGSGAHAAPPSGPTTASASTAVTPAGVPSTANAAGHEASSPLAPSPSARNESADGGSPSRDPSDRVGSDQPGDDDNVELIVDGDVVARCPQLRLVRRHVDQFDPDLVWLAVLESIAICMHEGGPMAADTLGVSGSEDHRHIVRQVLSSRGVSPTRVLSAPPTEGAAECQGSAACANRVEIMLSPNP
ncbi:MAG TPA: hypothetical protein VEK07_01110 [Polyangiaceae bacterium]|nr:hypothetical protein [Polyangiaceae bacterium]